MTAMPPTIGYVGVGLMGLPMVARLVSLGHAVRAYDILPRQMQAASASGAHVSQSPADAARDCEVMMLNLPTTDAVEQAMFGEHGVADALRPPQLVVDFSTIDLNRARECARHLRDLTGCPWIDAPVSGGPPAVTGGTLTVMAGGEAADIARVAPVLNQLSSRVTHMGPMGSGLAAKMVNQMIVGCTHAVLAEALLLAERSGIDAARIPECLSGGHADGTLLQRVYPRMAARNFAPQGYARQLLKDLEMVNAYVGDLKAPAPMTGTALSLYRLLILLGHSELDTSALFKIYER
ncbi:MAG TPA: NAD(P)-dependent oxidoreductase [Casimicrobiaceae bacterium]|nr:NAD(P)-dependent oxidoreductase [Casimicrobiaceae bacterium]